MTHIYISVHPVSHRLEWRGWGAYNQHPHIGRQRQYGID